VNSVFLLALLKGIGQRLADLGEWLMAFGAVGLFGITLLDSAFVPLPGGPDAAMVILSARDPAWMPAYALAATVGSTIGCTVLYLAARRAGVAALSRVQAGRRARIENLLGRYDMLAIVVAALMPPPFPFKAFVLAAGVFRLHTVRFVIGIFVGRAVRFLAEGWLAIEFGDAAIGLIKRHGFKVVAAVALIVAVILAVRRLRRRDPPEGPDFVDPVS
jgi:membrane protein YqaA with SNARE-associated domain